MSDIFVSYSSEERDRLLPLVNALEKTGWSVFWDRTIPAGKTWRSVIGSEIRACRSMIVVWTESSIASEWVLEEAESGKRRRILIPVLLDNVDPPFGFGRIQAANLAGWNGDSSSPTFNRLVADISSVLGPAPAVAKEAEHRRYPEAISQRNPEGGRLREQERQRSEEEAQPKTYEQSRKITTTRDHVFICYAREDEAFVLQLVKNLKGRGVPVWLDQWDIPPGSDWDQSIDNAIYDCAKFIIVLSSRAVESTEVRGELRTALDENKRIIPVIHSSCRVPRQLRTIQHVDFTSRGPDDESALMQLLRTLAASTTDSDVAQQTETTDGQGSRRQRVGIDQQEDQSPIAALVFDPASDKHVQRGNVMQKVVGGDQACDEYKYAIGIVNLSSKPIVCQLVLEHSDPHNASVQRLEIPLRVRGQLRESDGKFTLVPGNKQPTAYVEVLQELVLKSNPMNEHAVIRLIYANNADGKSNWFLGNRDHVLTFRLQGDMPKPVTIKLSVRSEDRRYVVRNLS